MVKMVTNPTVGGEWDFVRKDTDKSKILDRLKKEPSRPHFMNL